MRSNGMSERAFGNLMRVYAVAAMVFLVSGCAGVLDKFNKSVFDGGVSITATVQNPITREQQAGVELSYGLAASSLLAYARLPRCGAPGITAPCSSWPVIDKLKTANRVAYRALVRMRNFMDANQQVSAVTAFNEATAALRDFRATAYVNNVEIKAAP